MVAVIGGLDIASCPEFDAHLDDELHDPARPQLRDLIVDLTRLELLSAAGVRSVLRARKTAQAENVRLQLVINRPEITQVLTLLELDDQLCVRPDLDTARRAAHWHRPPLARGTGSTVYLRAVQSMTRRVSGRVDERVEAKSDRPPLA